MRKNRAPTTAVPLNDVLLLYRCAKWVQPPRRYQEQAFSRLTTATAVNRKYENLDIFTISVHARDFNCERSETNAYDFHIERKIQEGPVQEIL